MNAFKILLWDAVILPKQQNPNPVIYVASNPTLESLINAPDIEVYITSRDSGVSEANTLIKAVIEQSKFIAGYRPNFEAKTDLLAIVLQSNWHGYPLGDLGQVQVYQQNKLVEAPVYQKEAFEQQSGFYYPTFSVYADIYYLIILTVIIACIILVACKQ
jgi:hypothetical protein